MEKRFDHNMMKKSQAWNKSLKPTVTRVTPFADEAIIAPRYGGLVPPFYDLKIRDMKQGHKDLVIIQL